MPYEYRYPRPNLTVDCVLFGVRSGTLEVLLVERGAAPFEGSWAVPGGFVETDETALDAARRELEEETGLTPEAAPLEPTGIYDAPDRDPRGRVVSIAHWALVDPSDAAPRAGSDAADAGWHPADDPPDLAFDHADMLTDARDALDRAARTGPIGLGALDEPFSIESLASLYRAILGTDPEHEAIAAPLRERGVLTPVDGGFAFDRQAYLEFRDRPPAPFWARRSNFEATREGA